MDDEASDNNQSGQNNPSLWKNPAVIAAVIAAVGGVAATIITGVFSQTTKPASIPTESSRPSPAGGNHQANPPKKPAAVEQKSQGDQSPNIITQGPVNINFD